MSIRTPFGPPQWRTLLALNPHLSDRYVGRYAVLLAQAGQHASDERHLSAERVASLHPSRALSILLGTATSDAAPRSTSCWRIVRSGSAETVVAELLTAGDDLDCVLAHEPGLEQTWVPLHPDRHARIITRPAGAVVALRWPASSVVERLAHQERMIGVARAASEACDLPIEVWQDYTVCAADAGHAWVFSPNLGTTVEELLRSLEDGDPRRRAVVNSVAALRAAMLAHDVVWQGFAPRNMFLVDGRLILIDFEETVQPSDDTARAAECLLWHRVFFADCLTAQETLAVFGATPAWVSTIPDDQDLAADRFEHALFARDAVRWHERRGLLEASARLEGRHRRVEPSPRGPMVLGHELGHFWGDFVSPSVEVAIFRALSAIGSPDLLTTCLELFEAAMEADIIRTLRLRAGGREDPNTPYTDALTACLEMLGANTFARARGEIDDWCARLEDDPERLVSTALLELQAGSRRLEKAELAELLIGQAGTGEATQRSLQAALQMGVDFVHRHERGEGVVRHASSDELQALFALPLPAEGQDFADLLAETSQTVVEYSILQSHPGYLAFPDSANALASVAGGLLGRLLNQNLIAVDRSAPAATFVEIQVIQWLRSLAGYQTRDLREMRGVKEVGGLWTTGGHLSNHVAMLAALVNKFPQMRRGGLRALDAIPSVVMAGSIAHYSHSDSAFHLGLGWDAILAVSARPGYTTDVDAVEKALADPPTGRAPFMVVGVAGNCRTTGLDDLEALAEVCQRYGVWFHVDACHGGSLIFSERLRREYLAGLDQADSISLDPHKGLFTPYPSSYVLFKDPTVLTQFSRHETTVAQDDCWDLGLITPFLGSRGFESLSTWLMLRHIGIRRLGALVEQRQTLVRHLARRIAAAALFVSLNDVDFYRVAFVLCPPEARFIIAGLDADGRRRAQQTVSTFTSQLNTFLYRGGEVCFDEHTLSDFDDRVGGGVDATYTVMAACPGSPSLSIGDLDLAIDRLVTAARPVAQQLIRALRDATNTTPGNGIGGPAGWSHA